MNEPIFHASEQPFTLPEIADHLKLDYESVRGVVRRLREKPETAEKVAPLGRSRISEYSADTANFIARRCTTRNKRRLTAVQ